MAKVKVEDIEKKIKEKNVHWKSKENFITKMDEKEQKKLLGVIVPPEITVPTPSTEEPLDFAIEVDWRTSNHVTSIKNQLSCGACVSFGTVSTVESMVSIEKNQKVDLSEADLHFCSSHGANCNGWWPASAFDSVKLRGVCDETCFPYTGTAICSECSDRDNKAVKITTINKLTNVADAKNYLSTTGPLAAAMDVYYDFFSYDTGIYKHVTGTYQGGHCIAIIGYSEIDQCWICKNSWGTGWGENGFFKIAYGDCNIDSYEKVGATGVILPNTPVPPPPPVENITVAPTSINVAQLAGSYNFIVTSNVNWSVTSDSSWCTVSPSVGLGNGSFVANFTANTLKTPRKATLIVKGVNTIIYVTINQAKYVRRK